VSVQRDLASEDAEVRRRAVASLAHDDVPDRASMLIAALGDSDWRVRKEAVGVAIEHAEPWDLFARLVDALCQGENVGLRNAALEVLERLGPRSSSALLAALSSAPSSARKFVVAALGFAGGAGVVKLAELSNDPDPNTAQAALEALARVGGRAAEDALRAHLSNVNPVAKLAALEGLERIEARLTFDQIAPLLADRLVRRLAVRVLGFCEDPRAIAALFSVLSDPSPAAVGEAVSALGRVLEHGGSGALDAATHAHRMSEAQKSTLRALAGAGSDRARQAATWLLLLGHDREVLGVAAELASEDRLPPVALEALRAWGAPAVEPLLEAAQALSPRARSAALEMAADLAAIDPENSKSSRPALIAALRDALSGDEPAAAAAAAAAMAAYAEPSDAPALVRAASKFPEQAARGAGWALERLAASHPKAVEAAIATVTLDGPLGAALLPAIARVGGASAADRLQATLSADDPRARRAAVLVLPRLGGAHAVELAGFALADEDLDVQTAAVLVLAQLADDEGKPLGTEQLRLALRSGAVPVVAAAARALGAIFDRGSIPTLRELVREGRPGIAAPAMASLRTLGDPGLDDLLVEALGQTDEELVKEALRSIASRSEAPRRAARIALALEHPAWDVRQLAARLLGDIGGDAAVLEARRARETDPGVQKAIEDALETIRGGER
jgi:HEAT repeat protein